ncbi:MAG: hypothetical protein LJF06_10105 [Gemmatimonadetes bacterium]|nr:hypothetical protein [Gemmatimonadota bacterium]
MERGYVTLIGMSIAYIASFLGLWLAWYGWKKRHAEDVGAPVNTGFAALVLALAVAWYVWAHGRPGGASGTGVHIPFAALIALVGALWARWGVRHRRNPGEGEAGP